jgi:hypothetical protein
LFSLPPLHTTTRADAFTRRSNKKKHLGCNKKADRLRQLLQDHYINPLILYCYERTRDQGTLGSIAVAIVEPLGGHFLYILLVT